MDREQIEAGRPDVGVGPDEHRDRTDHQVGEIQQREHRQPEVTVEAVAGLEELSQHVVAHHQPHRHQHRADDEKHEYRSQPPSDTATVGRGQPTTKRRVASATPGDPPDGAGHMNAERVGKGEQRIRRLDGQHRGPVHHHGQRHRRDQQGPGHCRQRHRHQFRRRATPVRGPRAQPSGGSHHHEGGQQRQHTDRHAAERHRHLVNGEPAGGDRGTEPGHRTARHQQDGQDHDGQHHQRDRGDREGHQHEFACRPVRRIPLRTMGSPQPAQLRRQVLGGLRRGEGGHRLRGSHDRSRVPRRRAASRPEKTV